MDCQIKKKLDKNNNNCEYPYLLNVGTFLNIRHIHIYILIGSCLSLCLFNV